MGLFMSELDKKALPLEPYGCLDAEMASGAFPRPTASAAMRKGPAG